MFQRLSSKLARYPKLLANGLLINKALYSVRRLGVVIEPYYLFKEGLFAPPPPPPPDSGIEFREFLPEDVPTLTSVDRHETLTEEFTRRFAVGDRCFGLVRDGSVLCFTWCSLSAIEYGPVRRRLEKNEAYFYGAWTPYASRGLSLAPYLRYQCYRKLDSEGITVLYSLSDYFNRPAVRFKRKMGARELQTGLNVVIWGGLRKHWILKRPQAAR